MKKLIFLLLPISFLFSNNLYSQEVDLEEIKDIIEDLWANNRQYYIDEISTKLDNYNTHPLYNTQTQTNNLLIYAFNENKYDLLADLATVYLTAYDELSFLETKQRVNSNGTYEYCSVNFTKPMLAWRTKEKDENVLTSAQYLYLVTKTINYALSIPEGEYNSRVIFQEFLTKYVPVIRSHYERWLTEDKTFQVEAWGCNLSANKDCFNHKEFLERKLSRTLGSGPNHCYAVTDEDMWIIAGITEFLAANHKDNSLITLNSIQINLFQEHVNTGTKLIENRLIPYTTNLTNFKGEAVYGFNFEPTAWIQHEDYIYAGETLMNCPPRKIQVSEINWDISHARRWVHVYESLYTNRNVTGQSFPNKVVMKRLANQFMYKVFNGEYTTPLFTNYFDGTNGWYRYGYNGPEAGFGPYDQSISAITGGYCFWSKYNDDFEDLREALWSMILSDVDSIKTHVADHYGTSYKNCDERKEARDFDHANAMTHSKDLLQFLPTFFPSADEAEGHKDVLLTSVKQSNQTNIYRRSLYSSLQAIIYGPNSVWDVINMTSGDYDGDGDDELVTAFRNTVENAIYLNDNGNSPGSGRVYSSTYWDIVSVTSGDFDGDGDDELVTAYHSNIEDAIYLDEKGNTPGNNRIYDSEDLDIKVLTAGDFNGDFKDELIMVASNSDWKTIIFKNISLNKYNPLWLPIYQSNIWEVVSIKTGDFDGDGDDELVTAFRNSVEDAIYLNEDGNSPGSGRVYSSSYWDIGAMTTGDFDGDGDDELITGFNSVQGGAVYISETGSNPGGEIVKESTPGYFITSLSAGYYEHYTIPFSRSKKISKPQKDIISNQFDQDKIIFYPNPSNGKFYIKGNTIQSIKIYDSQGREAHYNKDGNAISLEGNPKGIYVIRFVTEHKVYTQKLILK